MMSELMQWIRVLDGLPEVDTDVLVYINECVRVGCRRHNGNRFFWHIYGYSGYGYYPSHWQLLPLLPEEM